MKFCEKCGKELLDEAVICPGCGCAVEQPHTVVSVVHQTMQPQTSYDVAVANAATTNTISIILLVIGIVCGALVNAVVGAIVCLIAEIVSVLPNTKLQGMLKKSVDKATAKQITKEVKDRNPAYKAAMIFSVLSLIGVIVFAMMMNI